MHHTAGADGRQRRSRRDGLKNQPDIGIILDQ